jgi:peptidoglycan/xylan/chitin deacetylase (PgdA/CDA1 family)
MRDNTFRSILVLTPLQIAEITAGSLATAGLAAGAFAYAAMWPASTFFGPALRAPRNPSLPALPELALTFDDGPNPAWTPQLLDILARHEIRATFFLIGQWAAKQHALVQRMHAAGHLIANHTWTHPNLAITSAARTREELTGTTTELEQIIGAPVRYFRPPYGARRPITLRIARELDLEPVLWNAITPDWTAKSPEPITAPMKKIIARNQSRGYATNLVLHDGGQRSPTENRAASAAAAAQLLEHYSPTHRFVTLNEWTNRRL